MRAPGAAGTMERAVWAWARGRTRAAGWSLGWAAGTTAEGGPTAEAAQIAAAGWAPLEIHSDDGIWLVGIPAEDARILRRDGQIERGGVSIELP